LSVEVVYETHATRLSVVFVSVLRRAVETVEIAFEALRCRWSKSRGSASATTAS
jgi:hypothetical protein